MNLVSSFERVAARQPRAAAIVMGERTLTFVDLFAHVRHVAAGLRALGVQRGDRVLIFSENCPEYLVAHFAVASLGAITATANPAFRESELRYIFDNCAPRCALVQRDLRAAFEASIPDGSSAGLSVVDILPIEAGAGLGFAGLPAAEPTREHVEVNERDGVLISYTSGTTSRPKPVFHGHAAQLFVASKHAAIWHFQPGDRVLVALPLSWLYGLTTIAQAALLGGATVVLLPHFNPLQAIDAFERSGITVFPGVTTMYNRLVQVANERGLHRVPNALRLCLTGGEPGNEAAFARFKSVFGVPIYDIYATSECLPILAFDPHVDREPRAGSPGRLVPGVEARILNAAGEPVGIDEIGELYARSPGQMLGYYREPELTAQVIVDGWFRTKDLFRRDAEGYYYMSGRASDLIIRGGANISPVEVEEVLMRHPAVAEAAVLGARDEIHGQKICAFVSLLPGTHADADELRTHCAKHLAAFKVPSEIMVLDKLPRGGTGKLLKTELAHRLD